MDESLELRDRFLLGQQRACGLDFDPTTAQDLLENGFPVLLDHWDLAQALDIPRTKLQWLCYDDGRRSPHYRYFQIAKRQGGLRQISAPKPLLRSVQQWIKDNILIRMEPHRRAALAFRPGKSIVTNAKMHCGKKIVVRIDLKDFFPSITDRRIKGLFERAGYNEGIASILSFLCTEPNPVPIDSSSDAAVPKRFMRTMPQGACTSPDLANLICRKLDYRIEALSKKLGFSYSRYADDLVFSHHQQRGRVEQLISAVYDIIHDEGFSPNEKKTCVMREGNRQVVTGLVVNDIPRLSRKDVRRFRAIAHQCTTLGYEKVSEKMGRDSRQFLMGYLAFARMVNSEQASSMVRFCPADIVQRIGSPEKIPPNSLGLEFVRIGRGVLRNFTRPNCEAKITNSFIFGVHPVTISQFVRVMGYNPVFSRSPEMTAKSMKRPVVHVSWGDAVEFCRRLSKLPEEVRYGRAYRLPTEAEWEYACRAVVLADYCFGSQENELPDYAWYDANSVGHSQPVGQKKPNGWGIHDMHGNVWEWCEDWYGIYPESSVTNPKGPLIGAYRLLRGGSFRCSAQDCRSSTRNGALPTHKAKDIGFRVIMSSTGESQALPDIPKK